MKKINFYLGLIIFMVSGCANRMNMEPCQPFITVVNLISAESAGDKDAARSYLDVISAYGSEDEWERYIKFIRAMGHADKLTPVFPFHDFETEIGNEGGFVTVTLVHKNDDYKIRYWLINDDGRWLVMKVKRLAEE